MLFSPRIKADLTLLSAVLHATVYVSLFRSLDVAARGRPADHEGVQVKDREEVAMSEDLRVWVNDTRLPFGDRCRLAGLLLRRHAVASGPSHVGRLASLDVEIETVVKALRAYSDAIAVWNGEGGR